MLKIWTAATLLFVVLSPVRALAETQAADDTTATRSAMTDEDFAVYVDSAMDELFEKQERLDSDPGFGGSASWRYDSETAKLELLDVDDRVVREASVVEIGSYAMRSSTWKWAWANESVPPDLREKAASLQELGAITGLPLFTTEPAFAIEDVATAWELVAMSVRHLDALGVYRAPSHEGNLIVFLAIVSFEGAQE